jgi:isopropylmalate/homocitrate/citramalate synthase
VQRSVVSLLRHKLEAERHHYPIMAPRAAVYTSMSSCHLCDRPRRRLPNAMDAKIQGIHVYMARKHARARRLHEETKQSNEHIATEYAEMPPSGSLVKRCNVRVALGGSHL